MRAITFAAFTLSLIFSKGTSVGSSSKPNYGKIRISDFLANPGVQRLVQVGQVTVLAADKNELSPETGSSVGKTKFSLDVNIHDISDSSLVTITVTNGTRTSQHDFGVISIIEGKLQLAAGDSFQDGFESFDETDDDSDGSTQTVEVKEADLDSLEYTVDVTGSADQLTNPAYLAGAVFAERADEGRLEGMVEIVVKGGHAKDTIIVNPSLPAGIISINTVGNGTVSKGKGYSTVDIRLIPPGYDPSASGKRLRRKQTAGQAFTQGVKEGMKTVLGTSAAAGDAVAALVGKGGKVSSGKGRFDPLFDEIIPGIIGGLGGHIIDMFANATGTNAILKTPANSAGTAAGRTFGMNKELVQLKAGHDAIKTAIIVLGQEKTFEITYENNEAKDGATASRLEPSNTPISLKIKAFLNVDS